MKKRNVNSLDLKKVTVSNFVFGGLYRPSDHACPSAVSCESVCFCVPTDLTDNCDVNGAVDSYYCEYPAENPVGNAPANGSEQAAN